MRAHSVVLPPSAEVVNEAMSSGASMIYCRVDGEALSGDDDNTNDKNDAGLE